MEKDRIHQVLFSGESDLVHADEWEQLADGYDVRDVAVWSSTVDSVTTWNVRVFVGEFIPSNAAFFDDVRTALLLTSGVTWVTRSGGETWRVSGELNAHDLIRAVGEVVDDLVPHIRAVYGRVS